MKYSIMYTSKTGNTKKLAAAIGSILPKEDVIYMGNISPLAFKADIIFIGFWADKGSCSEELQEIMSKIYNKKVFLFATAGFGSDEDYFKNILSRVASNLNSSVEVIGSFACQGSMPLPVREKYLEMKKVQTVRAEQMITNFDLASTHPDEKDVANIKESVLDILKKYM